MIHYHGTPITPNTAALAAIGGGHAFVSFSRPDQIGLALDCCQSFAVDNGAFSAWRAGKPVTDWDRYYLWIADLHRCPTFDFAVIPDVIDGFPKPAGPRGMHPRYLAKEVVAWVEGQREKS